MIDRFRQPLTFKEKVARAAGGAGFAFTSFAAACGGGSPGPSIADVAQAGGDSPGAEAPMQTDPSTPITAETTPTTQAPSQSEGFSVLEGYSDTECVPTFDVVEYILLYNNDPALGRSLIYGDEEGMRDISCHTPDGVYEALWGEFVDMGYDRQTEVIAASGDVTVIAGMTEDDVINTAADICAKLAIDESIVSPFQALDAAAARLNFTDSSALGGLGRAAKAICENNVTVPTFSGWADIGA